MVRFKVWRVYFLRVKEDFMKKTLKRILATLSAITMLFEVLPKCLLGTRAGLTANAVMKSGYGWMYDSESETLTIFSNDGTTNWQNNNLRIVNVNLLNSVTSINACAFMNQTILESIIISPLVKSIGDNAFLGCSKLKSIKIPNSVESIGNGAFKCCENLESVIMDESIQLHGKKISIGSEAFRECSKLTSIKIPDSVTSVSKNAFIKCDSLDYIIYPSQLNIDYIPSVATNIEYSVNDDEITINQITLGSGKKMLKSPIS